MNHLKEILSREWNDGLSGWRNGEIKKFSNRIKKHKLQARGIR